RPGDRFVVVKVIDGDTVELQGGDRLRLLSIDTPEHGEPLYTEATALLSRVALNQQVRIEFAEQRRDKYGRLLGYLFIDTLFVNRMMLDSGLAYLYLMKAAELNRELTAPMLAAQRTAMTRRVGLWNLTREPEDYYLARKGSLRLHRPECNSVRDLPPDRVIRYLTREEGLAEGLSPCRNCKP
ncbi:MAG: thermonuclease family protein, partial [candidate division Zixibacteria bacterium]|nr:thermonuclease family protein [candidate division Zixibacteria bacterium]